MCGPQEKLVVQETRRNDGWQTVHQPLVEDKNEEGQYKHSNQENWI